MFKDKLSLVSGIVASLIWGLSPAFTRILSENWGVFTTGMLTSFIGGIIAVIYKFLTTGFHSLRTINKRYWIFCGISYMIFTVFSNLSVGISRTHEEVIISGMFRLLWPLMTLIFTVPIQGAKVNKKFYIAISLSALGIIVANIDMQNPSIFTLANHMLYSWVPCFIGLISSICWGIYSNCYSKYIHYAKDDFIGLIMIGTGFVQFIGSIIFDTVLKVQMGYIHQFCILILSAFFGNVFWNFGMRGKYNLGVIIFANFIPVISTIFTGVILQVTITPVMLLGSFLIAIGTIWSQKCFI